MYPRAFVALARRSSAPPAPVPPPASDRAPVEPPASGPQLAKAHPRTNEPSGEVPVVSTSTVPGEELLKALLNQPLLVGEPRHDLESTLSYEDAGEGREWEEKTTINQSPAEEFAARVRQESGDAAPLSSKGKLPGIFEEDESWLAETRDAPPASGVAVPSERSHAESRLSMSVALSLSPRAPESAPISSLVPPLSQAAAQPLAAPGRSRLTTVVVVLAVLAIASWVFALLASNALG